MVIAAGDQRGPRRRAERRRMELNVAEPRLGNAVQVRSGDDAAEGARYAVALVIGHDEEHVGGTLGRHHARRPPGRGILAASLITPPNFGGGGGICFPLMVVVASA